MIAKLGFRVKYHNWWLCCSILHYTITYKHIEISFSIQIYVYLPPYHIEIYVIYLNYFEKTLLYLKSYLYIPAQIIYTILHRIIALFVHCFKQNNVQKQHQSFLYTKKTDLILWASTCPCIDSHITSKTVFAMSYTIEAYQ